MCTVGGFPEKSEIQVFIIRNKINFIGRKKNDNNNNYGDDDDGGGGDTPRYESIAWKKYKIIFTHTKMS